MSDDPVLVLGANELEAVGDIGAVQVASGWAPDGEPVVLLRMGPVVLTMTEQGARDLAQALQAEADLVAKMIGQARA